MKQRIIDCRVEHLDPFRHGGPKAPDAPIERARGCFALDQRGRETAQETSIIREQQTDAAVRVIGSRSVARWPPPRRFPGARHGMRTSLFACVARLRAGGPLAVPTDSVP